MLGFIWATRFMRIIIFTVGNLLQGAKRLSLIPQCPDSTEETGRTIITWLSPPNVSVNHYIAARERLAHTGDWFFATVPFSEFMTRAPISLWLFGLRKSMYPRSTHTLKHRNSWRG